MNYSRQISIYSVSVLACALCLAGTNVIAGEPTETVTRTVDGVIAALADDSLSPEMQRRQVKALIGEHFDFRAMSSRVLATNWKKATPAQRSRFTALFRELLSNTYWRKISGYSNEQISYISENMRSDRLATVKTLIRTDTADIPVDYKLYKKDDQWLAYDVVIEQVSLVRNYRGSFQKIVRNKGLDGLISQLQTKVAESSNEPIK